MACGLSPELLSQTIVTLFQKLPLLQLNPIADWQDFNRAFQQIPTYFFFTVPVIKQVAKKLAASEAGAQLMHPGNDFFIFRKEKGKFGVRSYKLLNAISSSSKFAASIFDRPFDSSNRSRMSIKPKH